LGEKKKENYENERGKGDGGGTILKEEGNKRKDDNIYRPIYVFEGSTQGIYTPQYNSEVKSKKALV
jgi:hypothetical protein